MVKIIKTVTEKASTISNSHFFISFLKKIFIFALAIHNIIVFNLANEVKQITS